MGDTILITGGTGKTGALLAQILREDGARIRVASRSAREADGVRFDWHDEQTYGAALENARAVYLVAPQDTSEPLEAMRPFLERAQSTGVERMVLLSASMLEAGGPMMGAVHAWLAAHAPGWNALRPSWFMQNFTQGPHAETIRQENAIYSAAGDGRVPFIDARDIAAVAARLLSGHGSNSAPILTGPQALSYDEIAAQISQIVGRPIVHRRLTEAELARRHESAGVPAPTAHALAGMDAAIAAGAENRTTGEVKALAGREPNGFESFARAHRSLWQQ